MNVFTVEGGMSATSKRHNFLEHKDHVYGVYDNLDNALKKAFGLVGYNTPKNYEVRVVKRRLNKNPCRPGVSETVFKMKMEAKTP